MEVVRFINFLKELGLTDRVYVWKMDSEDLHRAHVINLMGRHGE